MKCRVVLFDSIYVPYNRVELILQSSIVYQLAVPCFLCHRQISSSVRKKRISNTSFSKAGFCVIFYNLCFPLQTMNDHDVNVKREVMNGDLSRRRHTNTQEKKKVGKQKVGLNKALKDKKKQDDGSV